MRSAHLWCSQLTLKLLRRSKRSGPHKRGISWNWGSQRERPLILWHMICLWLYRRRESLDHGFEEWHLHLRSGRWNLGRPSRSLGVRLEVVSNSLNDGLRIPFLGIERSRGRISNDVKDSKRSGRWTSTNDQSCSRRILFLRSPRCLNCCSMFLLFSIFFCRKFRPTFEVRELTLLTR